jgi:hypothetical protein
MDAVREELTKQNVMLFTSVIQTHKEGDLTSVVTLHTFVDGDSGESFEIRGFGQGKDNSDKGGPKAITSAVKYSLMKTLLMSTGDDPEATDETGKKTGTVKAKAEAKAPAKTYGFSNRAKAPVEAPKLVTQASTDEF